MEGEQKLKSERSHIDSTKIHSSNAIYDQVLRGLNEQRQKGLFCDVVLVADGKRFLAHRNILAARSSYFNSMFTNGMQETYQKEVELVGISSIDCEAVLDFLYGIKPSLDRVNVYSVLMAAHLMQLWELIAICCEYLERELDEENYLLLQEFASVYCLEVLDSAIDCFVLKNFVRLCITPNFIEKVSLEKLCLYLDSDRIQVDVEQDLLNTALQWLSHRPGGTKESQRVLQNIRFSLIPKRNLINLIVTGEDSPLRQHINCQSFIDEALHYHENITAQPVLQNRRSTLRADGDHLLFLGGVKNTGHALMGNDSVYFLDPKKGKWIAETQIPFYGGYCRVAVLGNFIFCAGCAHLVEVGPQQYCILYRYDPRWKLWTQVASMNLSRRYFYFASLENKLIAVGGLGTDGDCLSSVEVYSPQLDTWSFGVALPRPTYQHAGTTYNQHVYISGGANEFTGTATRSLLCYNNDMDTWEERTGMGTPRGCHNMCVLGDHIYAIGGSEEYDTYTIPYVERYSPVCDQWTYMASVLETTSLSGVAVWRGKIYVLGGETYDEGDVLVLVQVYDVENDKWRKGPPLPERSVGLSACICPLKETASEVTDPLRIPEDKGLFYYSRR